jgi:nucleoid DNA-binding protein
MEIDVKPRSMSMKDYLIRVLAVKTRTSEKVIESVVNHQFQSANVAMKEHNSVELSGFGKFYFNVKKAERHLVKLNSKKEFLEKKLTEDLNEQARNRCTVSLTNVIADIQYIESKIKTNEFQTDLRGMEEQADSSLGHEGED